MRYGVIFFDASMSIKQVTDLAVSAERQGLDSVYVTEAWRSGFVVLSAIAAATDKIEVGSYILNAYGRSPWLTAMSAVDLDELSGGRFVLGIGTGNKHINEAWQGVPQARPLRKMEEYITVVKKAVSAKPGETVQFQGDIHSINWPVAVKPVRETIPVYMAALYPKMTAVAGRVADGLALGAMLSPDYIKEVVMPNFRQSASDAGRNPDQLKCTVSPFVAVDEDEEVARKFAREAICHLYSPVPHPYYDYVLREQGFSEVADACTRYVPEGKLDKAMATITDEVLDAVTISGSMEHCQRQLKRFEGLVDQILFVNVNMAYAGESQGMLDSTYDTLFRLARV